tara:strand:+ start:3568 stop:3894 length:327 start_codon:yes stop_codon:yes gene_type:complete
MAATITWSIDTHKHETAGKKCIKQVSYRISGVDGDVNFDMNNVISLDRPSDSDMKDYSDFLGSGDTALIAAVKAKLGDEKVKEEEDLVKAEVEKLKAPTEVWTSGAGS